MCGAFKVTVVLDGAKESDAVLLQLQKADGSLPTAEEVKKLEEGPAVKTADTALSKARAALTQEMQSSYIGMKEMSNLLAADAPYPAMEPFNTALTGMRAAVGPAFQVVLTLKCAGSGGAECVRVDVVKPHFADADSESFELRPVTLLDAAKSMTAKDLFNSESSLAEANGALTKAVRACEATGCTVDFSLKKKKLAAKFTGGEGDELADKKAAVRKAMSAANSQLFKLFKASRNSHGVINLTKALVALLASFKTKAEDLAKKAGKTLKDIIVINPSIKFDAEGEVEFDLGIKINLPEYEGQDWKEILMHLLPGPAKLLLTALLGMKDKIVELFPRFKELAEQVQELVQKAEEVFKQPGEQIKEAFGEENNDPFAVPKALAAATGNLKTVSIEPIKIVKVFSDTIIRVNDEMSSAVAEIKVSFA